MLNIEAVEYPESKTIDFSMIIDCN